MDFITHLPNSFGHTVIWVICDRLTKLVYFMALPTKFSVEDLTHRFSVDICRLNGIPKTIITDRDPLFLSMLWKELFKIQGTTLSIVRLTTRRPTAKPRSSTELLSHIYVVLSVIFPAAGSNSYIWQSCGTTPPFPPPSRCVFSKRSMTDILPPSLTMFYQNPL
jgi:hypothetical protein